MTTVDARITSGFDAMKARAVKRDGRMNIIRGVRSGLLHQLFPDQMPAIFDGSMVANFIDVAARDMAESVAPLPTLACASGAMRSQADRQRAEAKNRIGDFYWRQSNLEVQMPTACDWWVSYGFVPFVVEPDPTRKVPIIIAHDPVGAYFEEDRWGNVVRYGKSWEEPLGDLVAKFPGANFDLRTTRDGSRRDDNSICTVVHWVDKTNVTLYEQGSGAVLASYAHKMSQPPVRIAKRPGIDPTDPRGQFDDIVGVQLARAMMAAYGMQAAHDSVNAPIAMSANDTELAVGPGAVITSDNPRDIHRVDLSIPHDAFVVQQMLDQEMHTGSRYPDARQGITNASVVTGRGMSQLTVGFDSQIRSYQEIMGNTLRHSTSLAFEMDEVWFAGQRKTIRGTLSGRSYELNYEPVEAISGNYECDVTYGFATGQNPQSTAITLLQFQGAGLLAKETAMQNLPMRIDVEQEMRLLDASDLRDGLKQSLLSIIQAAGPMLTAGQDPLPFVKLAVDTLRGRQDGKPFEDLLQGGLEALVQQQQEAAQQAAQQAQGGAPGDPTAGGAPGGDAMAGIGANGLPIGVAPGQAGMPQGGLPAVQNLVAGMVGGRPVMGASIRRRQATGAR